jgi:hypothetical protein
MADKEADTTSFSAEGELTEKDLEAFRGDWSDGEQAEEKTLDSKGNLVKATTDDDASDDSDESDESDEKADDSSEEEATDEGASDDEETTEEDEKTEGDESDESASEEDDKSSDKDKGTTLSPEEQKRHNDEMAKARIAEREARNRARQAETQAQEATIERYLQDAGDDEAEKAQRQLNVDAWRVKEERIQLNQERLDAGIQRAFAQVPMLNTGSDAAKEELSASLDDFEARFIVKDEKGRPTAIRNDPATGQPADVVQFLQAKAKSIERLQGDGATKQVSAKSKEKSRTMTPPVRAPKKEKTDPAMDAFKAEAARY